MCACGLVRCNARELDFLHLQDFLFESDDFPCLESWCSRSLETSSGTKLPRYARRSRSPP